MGNGPNETANSYGRPTATSPPTPRTGLDSGGILPRPVGVYPPNHRPRLTNYQHEQTSEPMEQETRGNTAPQQRIMNGNVPGFNLSPMLFPITMSETGHGTQHPPQPKQTRGTVGVHIQRHSYYEFLAYTRAREAKYPADTRGNGKCRGLLRLLWIMLRPDCTRDARGISGGHRIRERDSQREQSLREQIQSVHTWFRSGFVPL